MPIPGGFAFAVAKNHSWKSFEEDLVSKSEIDGLTSPTIKIKDPVNLSQLRKPIPKGKLGNLEVGRIICGGNLVSGFSHSLDLIYVSRLLKTYFTEKRFWILFGCAKSVE